MDLHPPAGDAHVIDNETQQLLAVLEVELVDAEGCSASEVADSLLEAVIECQLLALGDQFVALLGQGVVAGVNLSCPPLHLVELE